MANNAELIKQCEERAQQCYEIESERRGYALEIAVDFERM